MPAQKVTNTILKEEKSKMNNINGLYSSEFQFNIKPTGLNPFDLNQLFPSFFHSAEVKYFQ